MPKPSLKNLVAIALIASFAGLALVLVLGFTIGRIKQQPAAAPTVSDATKSSDTSSNTLTAPTTTDSTPVNTPASTTTTTSPTTKKTTTTTTGGTTTTPPAAPALSLAATPTSIANGASATLSWSSSNATSCTASGAWSGAKATSGSASTGALTVSKSYSLSCSGAGGSVSKSVTVTVAAAAGCGTAGGACTAAEVATHNSQSNCWVIYGGYYYNVTSYVNSHPGGRSVFNSTTCGHDITSYLNGSASTAGQQHHHASTAYSVLASYKIGPVN